MRRFTRFRDRVDAGRRLAEHLADYAGRSDVLVLGLPRGGVPVAAEVAAGLRCALDVLVVRKVGVPGHEELAMGAVAAGTTVLNGDLIARLRLDPQVVDEAVGRAQEEMRRKELTFRGDRPRPEVADRTVIVVDDGLATGATMSAAVQVLAHQSPAALIVAAPVGACDTVERLAALTEVTGVVCVIVPDDFAAVGYWYDDFTQTTDSEVLQLLER